MKKHKYVSKIIALMMVMVLAMFTLVACGSSSESSEAEIEAEKETAEEVVEEETEVEEAEAQEEEPQEQEEEVVEASGDGITIGMIWYGNVDPMGTTFYSWANEAADALGVDLIWQLGSFTTEEEVTDCENLISAGCDGIYFVPMAEVANLQLGNLCEEAGVYWATSNRDIVDTDIYESVMENPYFVCRIHDETYEVCKEMVRELAENGVTKVCILSGDPSDPLMADRNSGFSDGCEEYGIEILATTQGSYGDSNTDLNNIANFCTLYPDMDGLLLASSNGGAGAAAYQALETSGREKGSIKMAVFDNFDGSQDAFDDGWLVASCGGYTTECLVSFLALVNRVEGNIASDSVMEMTLSPLMISSPEDMEVFSAYVDNPDIYLYSDELIQSLVGPDVTEGDYQAVLDEWSLDFVKEAAGLD